MLPNSPFTTSMLAVLAVLPGLLQVYAAPVPAPAPLFGLFEDNDTPTTAISTADLESRFLRSAEFAAVSYCSASAVTSWQCGPACDKVGKGVKVIAAGGGTSSFKIIQARD